MNYFHLDRYVTTILLEVEIRLEKLCWDGINLRVTNPGLSTGRRYWKTQGDRSSNGMSCRYDNTGRYMILNSLNKCMIFKLTTCLFRIIKAILNGIKGRVVSLSEKSIWLSAVTFENVGLTYTDSLERKLNSTFSGCTELEQLDSFEYYEISTGSRLSSPKYKCVLYFKCVRQKRTFRPYF